MIFIIRGEKFRTEFSHLGEMHSIIPETARVMALTATATITAQKSIIRSLSTLRLLLLAGT